MKKPILQVTAISILSLAFASVSFATPVPHTYRSARVMAMGGAHIAIADDDATLFMNPAGLRQTRSFDLLDLEVEMSGLDPALIQSVQAVATEKDDQLGKVADLFETALGKNVGIGFRLLPNFIVGGFGFGILVDFSLPVQIADPILTEIRVAPAIQVGPAIGFGLGFLDDSLKVGVVGKGLLRFVGREDLRISRLVRVPFEEEENYKDLVAEKVVPAPVYPQLDAGVTGTVDAGVLYTIPPINRPIEKLKLTFGLVVRDIPVYEMTPPEAIKIEFVSDEAPKIPMSINFGTSIAPKLGPFRLKVGLDVEDLAFATTDDTDFMKRFHLGADLQIPPFFKQRKKKEVPMFSLQGGINQVYFGGGLNINIWKLLQIGVATYAEELGPAAGDKGDRRILLRIAL